MHDRSAYHRIPAGSQPPSGVTTAPSAPGVPQVLKQMDLLKGLCRQFIEVIQPMCVEVSDEEVADAVAAGVAGGAGLPKGARLHRVRQQLLQQKVAGPLSAAWCQ